MAKILILGGTHGNERTGVGVIRYFQNNPVKGIKAVMANPLAVEQRKRHIETDLNRSAGKTINISLEEHRTKDLVKDIRQAGLVLEFHNTGSPGNTCGIITCSPLPIHKIVARYFGIKRLVVMPAEGTLSGQNPARVFSFEISSSDSKQFSVKYFVEKIFLFNQNTKVTVKGKLEVYECLGTVPTATTQRLKINLKKLKNFYPLGPTEKAKLNLPLPNSYVPLFLGEYNKKFGFNIAQRLKS
jgi:hypothetical protein